MDRLGRIPEPGDTVDADGCRMEVLEMDGRAVKRVRLATIR
jgi:CBS domain containing-hemolysin-like protein